MKRFRFSLRSLFLVTAAVAIAVAIAWSPTICIYSDSNETAFTLIDAKRYEMFGVGINRKGRPFIRYNASAVNQISPSQPKNPLQPHGSPQFPKL